MEFDHLFGPRGGRSPVEDVHRHDMGEEGLERDDRGACVGVPDEVGNRLHRGGAAHSTTCTVGAENVDRRDRLGGKISAVTDTERTRAAPGRVREFEHAGGVDEGMRPLVIGFVAVLDDFEHAATAERRQQVNARVWAPEPMPSASESARTKTLNMLRAWAVEKRGATVAASLWTTAPVAKCL